MKRTLKFFLIVAVFSLVGCAGRPISDMSVEEKAYKILSTSLSVYNLTMQSVSDFQQDGYISLDTRIKINSIAEKYRLAHLAAVRSLYTYKRLSDAQTEEKLMITLDEVQKVFSDFLEYVEPILKEGVK